MKQKEYYNIYMLRFIFRYIPLFAFLKIIISIIIAFLDIVTYTYSFKYVIDSIQSGKEFGDIFLFLFVLLCVVIIFHFFKHFINSHYAPIAYEHLSNSMQSMLHKKATNVDISCYDTPEYYHNFIIASDNADRRAISVFNTLVELLVQIVSIGSLITILVSLDMMGLVFAITAFVIGTFINKKFNVILFKRDMDLKSLIRKRDYTGRIFYLPEYAKEVRLSNIKTPLIGNFENSIDGIISNNKKYSSRLVAFRLLNYLLTDFLTNGIYLAIILYKVVVLQTLTLGGFMALYLCMDKLEYFTQELMDNISQIHQHGLFIGKFKSFLAYENKINDDGKEPIPLEPYAFEVDHVSFRYPGNEQNVLSDVSLYIRAGEKVAIVGYNGAGKSTLAKLLLRLYEPIEGEIRVNNKNINMFPLIDYRHSIGTIFQDYHIYATSLAKNIAMNTMEDNDKMQKTVKLSGLEEAISSFDKGLNVNLGCELFKDGVILSGGEMQKVALSRIFYTDYFTLILDEASASLDAISEHEFYKSINKHHKNNTKIIISHRLSTTKDADRIYLFSNGRIVEQGTHEQLMQLNGEYADLFRLQARKYN